MEQNSHLPDTLDVSSIPKVVESWQDDDAAPLRLRPVRPV